MTSGRALRFLCLSAAASALLFGLVLTGCKGTSEESPQSQTAEPRESPGVNPPRPTELPPEGQDTPYRPKSLEELRKELEAVRDAQKMEKRKQTQRDATPSATSVAPAPSRKPAGADADPGNSKKLIDQSTAFADALTKALETGDSKDAKKSLVTNEELERILTSAGYDLIASLLLSKNEKTVDGLIKYVQSGENVEHRWEPGALSRTPRGRGVFRMEVPSMMEGVLTLVVDGTPVHVQMEQLFYVDGHWKIFRMEL